LSRAGAELYARQHDCIRRFLEECVDVCGGNPRLVQGMVSMALLSCASQTFNGNPESVGMYLENLGAELAQRVREGEFQLGSNVN